VSAAVYLIESAQIMNHADQDGAVLSNALHLYKFLHRRLQHLRNGAKSFYKGMCHRIGIPLGDSVKQQHLQRLKIRKIIQPGLQKSLLYPLPVFFMYRLGHIDLL